MTATQALVETVVAALGAGDVAAARVRARALVAFLDALPESPAGNVIKLKDRRAPYGVQRPRAA